MKIVFLIYDGITALDAVGPYDILNRVPGTEVQFVAKERGPVSRQRLWLRLRANSR